MACAQSIILSPELIYGVRLVTLLAKVDKVLRAKFHQHFSTDPAELYQEIKKHDKNLKLLVKQKVIHKNEYNILLPSTGKTNSSKFDISLLIFALITISPIKAPVTDWSTSPLPSDRSDGANFIRLRKDRNEILHSYFEFEEKRFTNIWDRIESSLAELGCDKQELHDLKSASLDPSLQADYEKKVEDLKQALKHVSDLEDSLKGVAYNVFSPIPSFVGREEEIMEVHQNLITRDKKHIAMVLYGLGGVGKSELVRKYCNRFALSYYKENVIWINAEGETTMADDFYNVAERISLTTKDEYGKLLSIKTVVNKVYRFFADRPVLFVFDNATNKSHLMAFMETNPSTNVSILITSQFTEWSERFIQLRTDVLSQNDAFALVTQNIDKKYTLNDNAVTQLCDEMQYLPLALQQSIAYIRRWSITIDKYLEHFQKYADKILETNQSDEIYNKTVKTTWNMALQKLKEEPNAKLAITLIKFMSFLDGKNIKKELFYEYYDEYLVNEALHLLQKYSLITITTFHDDLEQTILMHSLLQYVIRMESEQKHLQQFLDIIFHPLDSGCDIKHENYGKYWYYQLAYMFHQNTNYNVLALKISNYLPQLQTIFNSKGKSTMLYEILIRQEIFQMEKCGYNDLENLPIRDTIAQCLYGMGNYELALNKYQAVEKLLTETMGFNNPDTLVTQANIAFCLLQKGKYDEALSKYKEIEKLQGVTIGYKHPNTLKTQSSIADCFTRKGNYDEALCKYQEVEKLQTETIGYKNLDTLKTRSSIAQCLCAKGNYDEALSQYQGVEKHRTETIGYKHPDTLTTQHNMATCLNQQGHYNEALNKYREVENLRKETIGYKHPDTLRTQNNIAACLHQKGKYEEAITILREVQCSQIETIGYTHPDTFTTLHSIAQCLQQMGNYNEALSKYQEVEKLKTETIGYKHPDTLTTLHSIAQCLQQMGNYNEALNKYQEVEKLQRKTIGYKHPDTLTTLHSIAQCLHQTGNYDGALCNYREVETLLTEMIGYKNPKILAIQSNIAYCLEQKGNYDEALRKYQELEKLQTETIGFKHPDTLKTQHNMAKCLNQMGNYNEALSKYQGVEKLQTETIGFKHPDTLTTQHNMAICLNQQGHYDEALSKYREVENLRKETIGYKHPDTLKTQNNIAACLHRKGKYEKALTILREVQCSQIETIGYTHPDTFTTLHSIAQCLHTMGNYKEALSKYQEVEKLRTETIGYKHPDTLSTQSGIAQCLQQLGNYSEAINILREVKCLEIETFGLQHPRTLATVRNITLCLFYIWETTMKV